MYAFISKLLLPFTFLLVGLLGATVFVWRRPWPDRRRALIVQGLLLALLTLVCLSPIGYLALLSLEWPYPPRDDMPQDVNTIVVLSGAVTVFDRTGQHFELGADTLLRCLHADELYRRCGGCRIVATGGKVERDRPGPTLARAMRDYFLKVGVKPSDILVEEASTSTYENAVECRKLLKGLGVDRIVLVTDAVHMRRAARCFERQGFEVIPRACNHHATHFPLYARTFLPSSGAADDVETAFHEWLGLLWYWLNGRI